MKKEISQEVASELLEALKKVCQQYKNVRRAEQYPSETSLSIEQAEQAIAKAEDGN
jgi:hypothetical protein